MIKDFYICTDFKNYINSVMDQDLLLLQQTFFAKPLSNTLTSMLRLFSKEIKAYNDKCTL